jgi:hypothetical protein
MVAVVTLVVGCNLGSEDGSNQQEVKPLFDPNDNSLYAIKTDSKGLAKSPWPMRGQNTQHTGRGLKK